MDNLIDALNNGDADNGNVADWVAWYRRRLEATEMTGRTRHRNRAVLRALLAVMAEQRETVIETTHPDLVRRCAADQKTVLAALRELDAQGYVKWLGVGPRIPVSAGKRVGTAHIHRFTLLTDNLALDPWEVEDGKDRRTDTEPQTASPANSPIARAAFGDMAHDAFGGRRGIKRTDLEMLRWLAAHPGSTRYEAGQSGIVSTATAYRVINRLVEHGFVTVDDQGRCHVND